MNAMGRMQSKWIPKDVMLTVLATHCIHTSVNVRKMKFISYIYITGILGMFSINWSQPKMKKFIINN